MVYQLWPTACIPKDTGGCPDREEQLLNEIRDLKLQMAKLSHANNVLTRERDDLNIELQNLKASENFEPKNKDDEDELPLPPGISAEAARKRLFRACKRATDG